MSTKAVQAATLR